MFGSQLLDVGLALAFVFLLAESNTWCCCGAPVPLRIAEVDAVDGLDVADGVPQEAALDREPHRRSLASRMVGALALAGGGEPLGSDASRCLV